MRDTPNDTHSPSYTAIVHRFAERLDVGVDEASALLSSLKHSRSSNNEEPLDHLELLVAASINAQVRNVHHDAQFKRLKFLLRNNNTKAVKLANLWADNKISFDEMLAAC